MVEFKSKLSKKDRLKIIALLDENIDLYGDFYITKNNLRLFIRENVNILFDSLNKGDKIAYNKDGIILVKGFSDKANRKYIKVLTKNNDTSDKLLKVISWNLKIDLFVKIKKNNPLKEVLRQNGFAFLANRGKEILMVRRTRKSKGE